jgi:hypothetical protein
MLKAILGKGDNPMKLPKSVQYYLELYQSDQLSDDQFIPKRTTAAIFNRSWWTHKRHPIPEIPDYQASPKKTVNRVGDVRAAVRNGVFAH